MPVRQIYSSTKAVTLHKENYSGEWHNNMKEGMGTQVCALDWSPPGVGESHECVASTVRWEP